MRALIGFNLIIIHVKTITKKPENWKPIDPMIVTSVNIVKRGQPGTRLGNMVRPATTPKAPAKI